MVYMCAPERRRPKIKRQTVLFLICSYVIGTDYSFLFRYALLFLQCNLQGRMFQLQITLDAVLFLSFMKLAVQHQRLSIAVIPHRINLRCSECEL